MRRREFIGGLGGAAAWPVVALAQNAEASKIYRIGYLGSGSPATSGHYAASFRDALGNLGYVEGRNTVTSYHWVAGDFDRRTTTRARFFNAPLNSIKGLL